MSEYPRTSEASASTRKNAVETVILVMIAITEERDVPFWLKSLLRSVSNFSIPPTRYLELYQPGTYLKFDLLVTLKYWDLLYFIYIRYMLYKYVLYIQPLDTLDLFEIFDSSDAAWSDFLMTSLSSG